MLQYQDWLKCKIPVLKFNLIIILHWILTQCQIIILTNVNYTASEYMPQQQTITQQYDDR